MKNQPGSTRKRNISSVDFDPFNDRLSRDIRNTLSGAFINALSRKQTSDYQAAAEKWLAEKPIASRLDDALLQSLVLWNNGLFFEFHEHLERIWHQTSGDEYQALKGLIKAAGVYIHMEHNRQQASESLSEKSLKLIRQYSHCLAFITNLNVLIQRLEMLAPVSPKLENPALI